jgi:hypothetical protein
VRSVSPLVSGTIVPDLPGEAAPARAFRFQGRIHIDSNAFLCSCRLGVW